MESKLDIKIPTHYDSNGKQPLHLSERSYGLKNYLERIRKLHGLTQDELAEKLEVSRQTISSLENGRYNPSVILAFKIAKFFGKKIEDIFIYEVED